MSMPTAKEICATFAHSVFEKRGGSRGVQSEIHLTEEELKFLFEAVVNLIEFARGGR